MTPRLSHVWVRKSEARWRFRGVSNAIVTSRTRHSLEVVAACKIAVDNSPSVQQSGSVPETPVTSEAMNGPGEAAPLMGPRLHQTNVEYWLASSCRYHVHGAETGRWSPIPDLIVTTGGFTIIQNCNHNPFEKSRGHFHVSPSGEKCHALGDSGVYLHDGRPLAVFSQHVEVQLSTGRSDWPGSHEGSYPRETVRRQSLTTIAPTRLSASPPE